MTRLTLAAAKSAWPSAPAAAKPKLSAAAEGLILSGHLFIFVLH